MTIPSATSRNDFIGAGSTNVFGYTYRIINQLDIRVTVRNTSTQVETLLVIATDYTVSGVGALGGGNVTLVDAGQPYLDGAGNLNTGFNLTLRRVRTNIQETDVRNQGPQFPKTYEDALDHQTMIAQQQQDELDRSLKLPETVDPATVTTELPVPVALTFLQWNTTATAIQNATLATIGTLIVPGSNGMVAFTTPTTLTARTITGSSSVGVTNGDGQAGNPTLSVPADGITAAELRDDAAVDANRSVTTDHIRNLAVTTAKINALAVTAAELAADAVTTAKILNLAVTTAKINALAVTAAELAANAVTTAKILDGNVTAAKLASGLTVPARQEAVETTQQNTISNTAEQTIYTDTITGGNMGASGALIMELIAEARTDVASNLTLRVKFGATTIATIVRNWTPTGGHNQIHLRAYVQNLASESSQRGTLTLVYNDGSGSGSETDHGTSAIDTSSGFTFEVTAQWSVAPVTAQPVRMFCANVFSVR